MARVSPIRQATDWRATAQLLAEGSDRALFVLDAEGRIRLVNRAFERLFGWSRPGATGLPVSRLLADAALVQRNLGEALRGAAHDLRTTALAADGRRLEVSLGLQALGSEATALLVEVVDARGEGVAGSPSGDAVYEISALRHDFGRLLRVLVAPGGQASAALVGRRCFEALFGQEAPCPACPVVDPSGRPWPRSAVLRPADAPQALITATAEILAPGAVRMSVRTVGRPVLDALGPTGPRAPEPAVEPGEGERAARRALLMGPALEQARASR